MKKITTIIAAFFMIAISANVMAQNSVTTSASATATIISPLKLTKITDLAFGKIVPNSSADGTLTIAPSATLTVTPDEVTTLTGLPVTAASYTLEADINAAFTLTLPTSIELTGPSTDNMTVKNFISNLGGTGTYTLSTASQTLYVGATIEVSKTQTKGAYTGTYDVTVAYN